MTKGQRLEIQRLVEGCQHIDNSELVAETTAGVGKLLAQRTLEDAAEHGSMTAEEVDGLLKFYDEANESLMECEEPGRNSKTQVED